MSDLLSEFAKLTDLVDLKDSDVRLMFTEEKCSDRHLLKRFLGVQSCGTKPIPLAALPSKPGERFLRGDLESSYLRLW